VGHEGHLSYYLQEASHLFLKQSKSSLEKQSNTGIQYLNGGKNFPVCSSSFKRCLNPAFVSKFQLVLNTTEKKNEVRVSIERTGKSFLVSHLKSQAALKCSAAELIMSTGQQGETLPSVKEKLKLRANSPIS